MSLLKEYPHIGKIASNDLNLDIPFVYIVTINKTESESVLLFDGKNSDLMPYSGRYIHWETDLFACNNTAMKCTIQGGKDGFPFPVKLKIECPATANQDIDTQTIESLIDQIYHTTYLLEIRQTAEF